MLVLYKCIKMSFIVIVQLDFLPKWNGFLIVMRLCTVMIKQLVNWIATVLFSHKIQQLNMWVLLDYIWWVWPVIIIEQILNIEHFVYIAPSKILVWRSELRLKVPRQPPS